MQLLTERKTGNIAWKTGFLRGMKGTDNGKERSGKDNAAVALIGGWYQTGP